MRLIMRPFRPGDAAAVQQLAGKKEIADATAQIPHPYEDGMAEEWIATHGPSFTEGTHAVFAVTLKEDGQLLGACALTIDGPVARAELGYWIGMPYWNNGYATEASQAVIDFGFETLGLNRIYARHLARNPSSGQVMKKIGMREEGTARQDAVMWGEFEDVVSYGLLREDWLLANSELQETPGPGS